MPQFARQALRFGAPAWAGGVLSGAWLWRAPEDLDTPPVSPLCGTYQLTSCTPCLPKSDVRGLMVHQSDGTVSTQLVVRNSEHQTSASEHPAQYVGYSGRWWTHDSSTYLAPHYNKPLVEHHIKASSLPRLIGKKISQEYSLSADGQRLTTSNLALLDGRFTIVATLEWQRVGK